MHTKFAQNLLVHDKILTRYCSFL